MHSMHGLGRSLMRTYQLVAVVILASLFTPSAVWADADAEREALAQLIHEIDAVAPLIERAESQANPDARIRFRYDWLRQDLERIQAGIQAHIGAPRAEPRPFPPLRGDYRQ